MRRGEPIRQRSGKRARVMVARRRLVAEVLEASPVCQAMLRGVCTGRATEVHEVLTRARARDANAAILDRANCRALCHECHAWLTAHPVQAKDLGMMLNSWDA